MTYEKIFTNVKKAFSKADKKKLDDDFAFQFNITGEGEGIFYVAYRGGIIEVAPYDYVDRNATLFASGEDFIKLATKKVTLEEAVESGHISVEGDYDCALVLNRLATATADKKEPVKKAKAPAVKKPAPPKKPEATNAIKDVSEKSELV
jgi:putative sterol carrier protein